MIDTKALMIEYLQSQHVMQLATVVDNQPWVCNLYYVYVDNKLYWASLPSRRHSQDLLINPNVAAAIAVQGSKGQKVIGLQIAGTAELISQSTAIRPIAKTYAKSFGRYQAWIEDFSEGKTEHRLYCLTPTRIVLFDEEHFQRDQAIVEWFVKKEASEVTSY